MKQSKDVIDLLIEDHEEVKSMFEEFESLSDRSKATKKKVAEAICKALTLHTQLEEEIFYPVVRRNIKDNDLMDEALVEHAGAKDLIAQIREMDPGDDLYDAKVKVLSEEVEHHIEEEETKMFPKVRASKIDLFALAEELMERREELEETVTGRVSDLLTKKSAHQSSGAHKH